VSAAAGCPREEDIMTHASDISAYSARLNNANTKISGLKQRVAAWPKALHGNASSLRTAFTDYMDEVAVRSDQIAGVLSACSEVQRKSPGGTLVGEMLRQADRQISKLELNVNTLARVSLEMEDADAVSSQAIRETVLAGILRRLDKSLSPNS
jgi:hypothetical protein